MYTMACDHNSYGEEIKQEKGRGNNQRVSYLRRVVREGHLEKAVWGNQLSGFLGEEFPSRRSSQC